jgi:hypothetical protein
MNVREDVGDRPSLNSRQPPAPRSRIEVVENDLIHPLVDGVTLHELLAKIANVSL